MTGGVTRIVVTFAHEGDLLGATRAVRAQGLHIVDAYTPYAVHGLDQAMGLRQSRLTWACFAFGMVGALLAIGFQLWSSATDWPINVGGKPWNSWPAFVPVMFELMVLFGGLGVVATFLVVSRLYPGKRAAAVVPGITNDRFALVCEDRTAYLPPGRLREVLAPFRPVQISHPMATGEAA